LNGDAILVAAFERLRPRLVAMILRRVLSFAQIAAILGLKENTANARAVRAAVKFRRLIPTAFRPPGASQS